MSTTHDVLGTPPEAERRARLSPPAGLDNVVDLARVQARRLLRHPALLLSFAWLIAGVGFGLPDTPYERYSHVTGVLIFVAGPAAFFAANLVATSERRSGADDWTPALPMPGARRTAAMLLAGVAVAGVVLVLDLLILAVSGREPTDPALRWAHVAAVPVALLGAVVLGVAVARLLPWPGAPLVVMVGLVAANIWTNDHQPYLGLYVDFAVWTSTDAIPAMNPGSPGWHLVYLVALVGLAACGALLRDVNRRWLPILGGGICAAVAVLAGALQLCPRPPPGCAAVNCELVPCRWCGPSGGSRWWWSRRSPPGCSGGGPANRATQEA